MPDYSAEMCIDLKLGSLWFYESIPRNYFFRRVGGKYGIEM